MTPLTYKGFQEHDKIPRHIKFFFRYIKSSVRFVYMQKNSEKIFSEVEVDPVTGDYYVKVPEVILNEMQWYEDTTLRWLVDGNEIVLAEEKSS